MQNKLKKKTSVQEVKKPIIPGSWHGRDAWKLAGKRCLSIFLIGLVYLIAGLFLTVNSVVGRILICAAVVVAVGYYQYMGGATQGQSDAAYGEILYSRQSEGHEVSTQDRQRSFHPLKGVFAVLVGASPFVLFALVFALMTKPIVYQLGVLPSWTEGLAQQSEFGDALSYYAAPTGLDALSIMRVIDRCFIMPFLNVGTCFGSDGVLLTERLSPLLLLIAPMGYALGYADGLKMRARINTGIKMGDDKKKRRERKARKQRQRSKTPERLI